MSEDNLFDPCEGCDLKGKEICKTCEYGSLTKGQRSELFLREYYGDDTE
jgi:hypothetical protein